MKELVLSKEEVNSHLKLTSISKVDKLYHIRRNSNNFFNKITVTESIQVTLDSENSEKVIFVNYYYAPLKYVTEDFLSQIHTWKKISQKQFDLIEKKKFKDCTLFDNYTRFTKFKINLIELEKLLRTYMNLR